jgi:hypothetical protein
VFGWQIFDWKDRIAGDAPTRFPLSAGAAEYSSVHESHKGELFNDNGGVHENAVMKLGELKS